MKRLALLPVHYTEVVSARWSLWWRSRITARVTINGVDWQYSKLRGWHDPAVAPVVLWPTGGAA